MKTKKTVKKIKNPFLKQHSFSLLANFQECLKTESVKKTARYVWTDSIEKGNREIYVRCLDCAGIFKLGNKNGSRPEPMMIDKRKRIGPCLICPHCHCHIWTKLVGYEPVNVDDIFTKNVDEAREYESGNR